MDYAKILQAAQACLPDMTRFLREIIAIPSLSGQEQAVVRRTEAEMRGLGYRTEIDALGNVLGFLGHGPRLLAFDAHLDAVDIGLRSNWSFDPYLGYEDEQTIGGRGASDQKGGMAAMLYSGKIMRDMGLLPDDLSIVMVGSVQEEDCDGLCWQYLLKERQLRPEAVVSSEPTDGGLYRGQRGRMEIRVETRGRSCHGSAPERGDNAILRMGRILRDLEDLAPRLHTDPFLGQGSLAVSEIFYTSPSRCAVADSCAISIDRRLTQGEDRELALGQIRELPSVLTEPDQVKVSLYHYQKPAWTGLVYPAECYFPTWSIAPEHSLCQAGQAAYQNLFHQPARLGKWTFSTNGVAIAGMFGIPVIGFGPGQESQAHAPNEITWKRDLVNCAAFYAALPSHYLAQKQA